MKKLTYCYPLYHNVSFKLIAEKHVEFLKEKYDVRKVNVDNIRYFKLLPTDYVIFHPLFYPFWYCWNNDSELKYQILKLKNTLCEKIIAFDTADSDRISDKAVFIANTLPDLIILPSEWGLKAYVRSGVISSKIKVIPHGVSDVFFENKLAIKTPELYKLYKYEKRKKILYFLMHSYYRKGADIVEKAVKKLREERKDFILVCKTSNLSIERRWCYSNCDFVIDRMLSDEKLKTLFDICDMVLLPSRGGGFELNGLEALMRNKPVVYPKQSCIEEYAYSIIPELAVNVNSKPTVLPNNPIHVGRGHEVNVNDFTDKIRYALDNLEELKLKIVERFRKEEREKYRWRNIAEQIVKVLES